MDVPLAPNSLGIGERFETLEIGGIGRHLLPRAPCRHLLPRALSTGLLKRLKKQLSKGAKKVTKTLTRFWKLCKKWAQINLTIHLKCGRPACKTHVFHIEKPMKNSQLAIPAICSEVATEKIPKRGPKTPNLT